MRPKLHILGINAFHGDASVALFSGGILRAAVEEERFNRIRHLAGLPLLSAASVCVTRIPAISSTSQSRETPGHI